MIIRIREYSFPFPFVTLALVVINFLVFGATAWLQAQSTPDHVKAPMARLQAEYERDIQAMRGGLQHEIQNRAARGEPPERLIAEAQSRYETAFKNITTSYDVKIEALGRTLPWVRFLRIWGADPALLAQAINELKHRDRIGVKHLAWFALTLFTCPYVHTGFQHLLGNMFFLLLFGITVETHLRSRWFAVLYTLGGVTATLTQFLMTHSDTSICIGASGAIAAIMGAYLIIAPEAQISLGWILGPFGFLMGRVSAAFFLLVFMMLQGVNGIGAIATGVTGGVAWFAHIGGFAAGIGWMLAREAEELFRVR